MQMDTEQKTQSPSADCSGTDCPMTRLLAILSAKWSLPVLYQLMVAEGPVRFGALKKSIAVITQRELSRALRQFEHLGLVTRRAYAEVPPRVEYTLTELGRSIHQPILALGQWAKDHGEELKAAEAKFAAAEELLNTPV
jgi:DNA-binding HxlR family transcriptional regulator